MSEIEQQIKWVIEFQGNIPVLIEIEQEEEESLPKDLFFPNEPNAAAKKRAKETLEKLRHAYQDFEKKQKLELEYQDFKEEQGHQNLENVSRQKEALVEESFRIAKTLEDFYAMIREVVRFMKFFIPKKNNSSDGPDPLNRS